MTIISKDDTTITIAIFSNGKASCEKKYTSATLVSNDTSFCYEITVGGNIVHKVGYQGTHFLETFVAP